jgi:hypothetical protein
MLKTPKYLLFLAVLSIGFSACASKHPHKQKQKSPTTYHPNLRKPASGKTDNCDCPKVDRRGRPKSNVKRNKGTKYSGT